MARGSRNKSIAASVAMLMAIGATQLSAHRRDEYLQAARIDIDAQLVRLELDLTAGIAVAQTVLFEVDRDRNGVLDSAEGRAYAARVVQDLRLTVDDRQLSLELVDVQLPQTDTVNRGEGAIRLQIAATMAPQLTAGRHRLVFSNRHHPDIGVYLANALAPASPIVAVLAQHRDVDQRELAIDYVVGGDAATAGTWLAPAAIAMMLTVVFDRLRRFRLRSSSFGGQARRL